MGDGCGLRQVRLASQCDLLLSDIYMEQGNEDEAEQLTWVAIDLVGQETTRALKQLVREQA